MRKIKNGGRRRGVSLQDCNHRGFCSGQIQFALSVCSQRVRSPLQGHHRSGVPDSVRRHRRQGGEGADLGHRRSGALQSRHLCLLPRRFRCSAGLWYQPPLHLWEHRALAWWAQEWVFLLLFIHLLVCLFSVSCLLLWFCLFAEKVWESRRNWSFLFFSCLIVLAGVPIVPIASILFSLRFFKCSLKFWVIKNV